MQQPGQCSTAPLEVAKKRHPPLAAQLGRYEIEREVVDADLSGTKEVSFFLNTGDCFAVLAEPLDGGEIHLGYALRIRGTPQPGDRVASAEPKTGGRDGATELSPELCPWEHQPLAIWNARPGATGGRVRLHLLRRAHPDPARLARERPTPPRAASGEHSQGGTCSDFECGEDCGSERRACDLDCFRNGSHEPAAATICKNTCIQLERACHRGCAVPCR